MTIVPELHSALRTAVQTDQIRARRKRRRRTASISIVAGFALSGTALAATGIWHPTLGSDERGRPAAATSPIAPSNAAALSVLARPQTEADRGPGVEEALRRLSSAGADGVHVEDVRLLATHEGGVAILVPVDRTGPGDAARPELDTGQRICVVYTLRNGAAPLNCGTLSALDTRGISGFIPKDHDGFVSGSPDSRHYGLVPDGVAEVRVTLTDGTTLQRPVQNNFFDASTSSAASPRLVEWLDSAGDEIPRSTTP